MVTWKFKRTLFVVLILTILLFVMINTILTMLTINAKGIKSTSSSSTSSAASDRRKRLKKPGKWASEIEQVESVTVNVALVAQDMKAYRDRVEAACETHLAESQGGNESINSWEFLINHEYKIVYCPIFKAASSTWIYNFLLMARANERTMSASKTSPVEFARKTLYPRPSLVELTEALNDESYESILIVREPFQRLLSAYRDKIENVRVQYYASLRCKIKNLSSSRNRFCDPTFSEFVDFVIDEYERGQAPNEHWAPYYEFCTPCQAHFDYILRFESLAEQEAAFKALHPQLSTKWEPHKLHSSHTNYSVDTKKYFSQLTETQIHKLIQIYHLDFYIFGYDPNAYELW